MSQSGYFSRKEKALYYRCPRQIAGGEDCIQSDYRDKIKIIWKEDLQTVFEYEFKRIFDIPSSIQIAAYDGKHHNRCNSEDIIIIISTFVVELHKMAGNDYHHHNNTHHRN